MDRLVCVVVVIVVLFLLTSCIAPDMSNRTTLRHYNATGSYTGESIVYDYGDRIHIRTYNKQGKLIYTSEGRK